MLVAVNDVGDASLCSLSTGAVISVYPFKGVIFAVSFSPDGKFLAVGKGHNILLFYAPSQNRQFNHLKLYRIFYGFTDDIICIDWSSDSGQTKQYHDLLRFIIAGSVDSTSRLFSVYNIPKIFVCTLAGHKNPIMGAFILRNLVNILTVSSGFICSWEAKVPLDQLRSIDDLTPTSLFRISNSYRNFRTFTVPTRRVQFFSLAVDTRGSLVAAGGLDTFEAYVWSVKTGQLLTVLTGHTAPISALAFNPDISGIDIELTTVSWDSTLRLWDVTGNSTDENNLSSMELTKEVVNFSCDALCVAYRGDGKQLAISLLNWNIVFYDPNEGVEMGTIDGHRDLGISQTSADDLVTPRRAAEAKKFQTVAYSVDGEHLIAGGDSKYVCLYSVPDKLLMKQFEVTCNLSLGFSHTVYLEDNNQLFPAVV
ncbi:Periodic tryptophan protein 2 like [Schistosoma japonicum]|nr:Periodic tryptophan protein 2 like [Schistosoma japonicum]